MGRKSWPQGPRKAAALQDDSSIARLQQKLKASCLTYQSPAFLCGAKSKKAQLVEDMNALGKAIVFCPQLPAPLALLMAPVPTVSLLLHGHVRLSVPEVYVIIYLRSRELIGLKLCDCFGKARRRSRARVPAHHPFDVGGRRDLAVGRNRTKACRPGVPWGNFKGGQHRVAERSEEVGRFMGGHGESISSSFFQDGVGTQRVRRWRSPKTSLLVAAKVSGMCPAAKIGMVNARVLQQGPRQNRTLSNVLRAN